ncbi:MAG: hypothetical protein PX483_21245 [Nostocales cyanobacterium LE14-WE4]|nr:hypothetical protein [Anabaena sp. AL09]MDJ0503324.1 hypothetical protein [Nostocales cyanobacterium LE14-WE4]
MNPHSALHFVIHQDYQYRANNGQIAIPRSRFAIALPPGKIRINT